METVEEVVLDETILDDELDCEGRLHPTGQKGHVIGQGASVAVISPCGSRVLICASRSWYMRSYQRIMCSHCGDYHPLYQWKFVPV